LYIEGQSGRDLTALDVTNPARIRRVAKVQLPAATTYDFVQELNDNSVLVCYRDGSGSALISFRHAGRPELVSAPTLAEISMCKLLATQASWSAQAHPFG
jgi:hypothetical protein